MKRLTRNSFWFAAVIAGSLVSSLSLQAQPAETAVDASRSNGPPVIMPPDLFQAAPGRSPVAFFRELLAANPVERIRLIAARPPAVQRQILAKVREYQALAPDQRELRLQVTELRYFLWPLMNLAPTNRAPRLAQVPANLRQLVEVRLAEWDKLPPDLQKELRDNEAAVRYFTELSASTPQQQEQLRSTISPARREMLERGVRQWQALPEEQRDKIASRFKEFFELTSEERGKALSVLSEPERQQIEKTLDKFENFSPIKRALCVRMFKRLASLSLEERQQFLKNAERWKLMSPAERQAWRDLVAKLSRQPAFTPGKPRPPLPSLGGTIRRPSGVTTNTDSAI